MKEKVDRRRYMKYGGGGLIILAGAAAGAYYSTRPEKTTTQTPTPMEKATPKPSKAETEEEMMISLPGNRYLLPIPTFTSGLMVEEAMAWRRSIREYKDEPIIIGHLSKLLWTAQGISELRYGLRTAPSAGATYPLEVYAVAADNGVVLNGTRYLPAGSYKYNHEDHSIKLTKAGDLTGELAKASLNQEWVRKAPVNIVVCSVYERTTRIYGERGRRYVHMEDGHVGQNIYLMSAALNLGTVAIGAFHDEQVKDAVGAGAEEDPLYVMPVGVPKEPYRISEEELSEYYQRVRRSE